MSVQPSCCRDGARACRIKRAGTAVLFALVCLVAASAHAHNPHDPVLGLGISPDYATDRTLFVATFPELHEGYRDILRSTDGGSTWSKLPKGMDNRFEFSAVRVSPGFSLDGTVYAATHGDGVYASTTRGNAWSLINTGLVGLDIAEFKIAGARNTAHTLFAAPASGGLFRRVSGATSWSAVLDTSHHVTVVAPSPDFATDARVMAADDGGNVWRSSDGGLTWTSLGNVAGAIIHDIAIAPGGAQEIVLATSLPGLFVSTDGGDTFTNTLANLPNEALNNIAVSPNYAVDRTLFCTTPTRSVYKSTNGGASWTLYATGAVITGQIDPLDEFSGLQISNNYAVDGTVFLSAFDGLFTSSDGGVTWTQSRTRQNLFTGLAFSPAYATDRRVMASAYSGGGFYTSANRGNTWTRVWDGWLKWNSQLTAFDIQFVANHVGAPMAVGIRNNSQIGFTSDFGASWTVRRIPNMLDSDGEISQVYSMVMGISPRFDSDQQIYLGTRWHGLLQTRDGGRSWRVDPNVPISFQISSVAVSPNYANDRTAFAANMNGEVWRTVDGGDAWTRIDGGAILSRDGLKVTIVALSPNFAVDHLVLVGTNNGLYRSTNGGNGWQKYGNTNMGPARIIQQIEFSPNFALDRHMFVNVRGTGLYRATLSASGGVTSLRNVGTSLLNKNVQFTEFRLSPAYRYDGTVLGASRKTMYRSTNRGDTWVTAGAVNN